MERVRGLFPKVYSYDSLLCAYEQARQDEGYSEAASGFSANLEENLINIQNHLMHKSYEVGFYRDPGKEWLVTLLPFCDHVVQWAIYNTLSPIFAKLSRAKKVNQQHERERQEKQMEHETQRQQQFLDVVKENSAVMSGVKALLKNMTEVQNSGFVRIHERLDEQSKLMSSVNTKIDATAENQREIASKLNKVWANSEKNK